MDQEIAVTLTAGPDRTKTVLDGNAVKWEKGDKVTLVFTHDTKSSVVVPFVTSVETPSVTADFTGIVSSDILDSGNSYHSAAYAYYPGSVVTEDGTLDFTLPSEQRIRQNGTFASGLNLTSAKVLLSDIRDDGNATAKFRNALSVLRFTLAENVTSLTLKGATSLAGKAPLEWDADGRLAVVAGGEWTSSSDVVTLLPPEGSECFPGGEVNLLVWPGYHSSMSVTVNTKDYGAITKTSTKEVEFEAAKFYTLNFEADTETLVQEIDEALGRFDEDLTDLESRLDQLETNAEKISLLLDQIQSVALMTDYTNNSIYAYYANQSIGMMKMDINLQYMVRPSAAMSLLLETCRNEGNLSEVLSMLCDDREGNFSTMQIKDAMLVGDILTVIVGADPFDRNFYEGKTKASLALQISDGNTDILSDFANLVPKVGTTLNISRTDNIPVLKGATFSMSYQYGAEDYSKCQVSISSSGFSSAPTITANNGTGTIYADFSENANLASMSVTITLKYAGEVADVKTLTFAEDGTFAISTPASVDYIGGEVSLDVTSSGFDSFSMHLSGAGDWIYETNQGVSGRYSLNLNTGSERTASVEINITKGVIAYKKFVTITQKAYETALTGNYYSHGERLMLNNASITQPAVNLVILGDGYQKKDLLKGGKFERSARSAMDAFFGIEPFKSFKNRFNVYMVAYESTDEGVDIKASGVTKTTYFDAWCQGGGNTAANCDNNKVVSVVQNTLGLTGAAYYRTVVLMLANTDEGSGSCAYPYRNTASAAGVNPGDGYASFAIATLAANNMETSSLIRHEVGGHAFGRLGDEYNTGNVTVDSAKKTDLDNMHKIGFYLNVSYRTDSGSPWHDLVGYDGTGYYEGAWNCPTGMYRPSESSVMLNNKGKYNAPSRRAIYKRIMLQTGGIYSDAAFKNYDYINL